MQTRTHSTNDELLYIDSIGDNLPPDIEIDRLTLLSQYIATFSLRDDWQGMDKDAIVAYAGKRLAERQFMNDVL